MRKGDIFVRQMGRAKEHITSTFSLMDRHTLSGIWHFEITYEVILKMLRNTRI